MKMAMELVDSIGELAGVDPITKLITLIIDAASTARRHNRVCCKFAQWLETIEGLLKPLLKIPKLMEHPETSKPLKQLEESLKQAYLLVIKNKDRSYPYRFMMGSDILERFRDARNDIKDCIDLVPLITLFVSQTIVHRVDTRCQGDEDDQLQGGRVKEDTETKGKKNNKEKGKGRGKGKDDTENEERRVVTEEGKGIKKGREEENKHQKKNVVETTAVLKVAMHCECNGCPDGIKRTIRKYPGVNNVAMEMDMRILSVTVAGHFDAKMLRDYVAKKTKKEVDLVGNGVWEGENHQVSLLETKQTAKDDSKSIGGEGKPAKGGNKNKKRVVPMVAATVVLKVGGTGLRCGCNGCVDKICNRLFNITGVQQVDVDTDKNQVTVTGTTMDMETLLETLGKKGRRPVEVVQPGTMDRKD